MKLPYVVCAALFFGNCAFAKSAMLDFTERMRFLAERDNMIAQNLANADTPNYKPRDIKTPDIASGKINLMRTNKKHFATGESPYEDVPAEILEIKPNGNAVTVEHELTKKNENAMLFTETVNLYNKMRTMKRTAIMGAK